jgi:hypothetical protein
MAKQDGRTATKPYRVRVGTVWYWVDPTVPASALEPGDMVIVYPVAGDPALAVLQSPFNTPGEAAAAIAFSSLEGERFSVARGDIAAVHLSAVDDQQ